jgi:ubiquitin carboxyl-terminal hydrolase 8
LHDGLTVSEIKERTKDYVTKQSKGASAISLINAAKSQSNVAQTLENEGDLKGAMAALIAAGCLMRMFMDSSELKAEGRKGVLWNAFSEFQEVSLDV